MVAPTRVGAIFLCLTVNSLSPTDTAYIAGLIDGEGTVTLCRKHRNENHQLAVSISNTEIELLSYVLDAIGAGKITSKRTAKSHHTPSYCYAIYNRQALALLEQTLPFLKTYKLKRVQLILEKYLALTPRNGKYTTCMQQRRDEFVKSVFAIKYRGTGVDPG